MSKVLVMGERLTFDFISVAQLRVIKEVYEGFLNVYGEKEVVIAETEDKYIACFTHLAGGSGMDLNLFGTFFTI